MSFLSVVEESDDFPYEESASQAYYKLYLPDDDQPHGYLRPEIVEKMPWTSDFDVQHSPGPKSVRVRDASNGEGRAMAVNRAFQRLVDICINRSLFSLLGGRHSELFAIPGASYEDPVYVERFFVALLGITQRGAHLVAYTAVQGEMQIWVSRRSAHLYTYPGMLDTTVAGGVKAGIPPLQTIVDESQEEASLPEALIREKVRSRGVLTHVSLTGKGFPGEQGLVVPDYIYTYDIELPADITPRPHDDEVSDFYCMTVGGVKKALLAHEFKPDAAAVMVDFLIRHSIITAENEPHFVEISMRLHRRLPFKTGPP